MERDKAPSGTQPDREAVRKAQSCVWVAHRMGIEVISTGAMALDLALGIGGLREDG